MTIDEMIRDEKHNAILTEKQQAKISVLSSGKIDKYEYLTGEEIIPPDQRKVIEQAKFAYSPLGKAFEKQTKTIEEQGKKQVKALEILKAEENKEEEIKSAEGIFPKGMRINEIKNEIDESKNGKKKLVEKKINKANKYKYDFQQYETIRSFGDSIDNGKISEIDQSSLLDGSTDSNDTTMVMIF